MTDKQTNKAEGITRARTHKVTVTNPEEQAETITRLYNKHNTSHTSTAQATRSEESKAERDVERERNKSVFLKVLAHHSPCWNTLRS